MAMKTCKDCGAEVSKSAKACPKCGRKMKSPVLRIVIGCIILIIGIASLATDMSEMTSNQEEIVETNKITLEKFNQIQTGMTYQEIVDIIGEEGTVLSESDIMNDERYKTTMYYWYGEDGISNANVTIQGGKVISKAQIGLE